MDHRQVWWYISEATADAAFEDRLYECHFISDALRIMREWSLLLYPAERHAFAGGGAGESSVHGGRRIRNCSVHSPPVPGTSIEPPCSCRRSCFSGLGGRGSRSST